MFSTNNNNTFIIDGSGNVSCASTLNVASSSNLSGNTGIGGNLNISGFLTCGNKWATFSGNFAYNSGSYTYLITFGLSGYPNLVKGNTFILDCVNTQNGASFGSFPGFTAIVNNLGPGYNAVVKGLYSSGNSAYNFYNGATNWNDALNVFYTQSTALTATVTCTIRISVLG